jgi:hypothetical protein
MFSLPFSLSLNLLEVLCPLKSIHVIKFSITNTHSQNLMFLLALWTHIDAFPLHDLPEILTPFLPSPHNSSFHRSFLFVFSSPRTSRRTVPPLTVGTRLPIPCALNHSFISLLDTSSCFPSHN